MKIAILVREETMMSCTGKGCFNAFNKRIDAFENYDGEIELLTFTHVGGDLDHKIEKMINNGIEIVHLSSCLRAKYQGYEALAAHLSEHFQVIGYTHGSKEGKTRKALFIEKKHLD